MQTVGLPETVVQAWGTEAARDFAAWLEERLRAAQFSPQVQVSAFVARQKVNVLMLERVSNLLLADEPRLVQAPDTRRTGIRHAEFRRPAAGYAWAPGDLP